MRSDRRLSPAETSARLHALGIERGRGRAFAFEESAPHVAYDFHAHRRHQLLYAMNGTARLESASSEFLLPPQRAAWIPAGVRHATHVNGATIVSVFFQRSLTPSLPDVSVFDVPPLLREMILHARRWPLARPRHDRKADTYFRALLTLVLELMEHRPAYALPRASSETTARAMAWVLEHLATASLAGAARHARTSPRTLRRRFLAETGLHFRAFVSQARMQRALELLAAPELSVFAVALEVGFQSQSAFAQAFRRTTGQAPLAFRRSATSPA